MEGLQPFNWKQLLHFATSRASTLRKTSSAFIIRCCSSPSSSSTTAAAPKPAGRGRRLSTCSTNTSDREAIRIKKVEELRSKGLEPYAYKWDRTHSANQLQEFYKNLGNGEELDNETDYVSVSGRIVACRAFGKLPFLTLRMIQGQSSYTAKGKA